MTKRNRSNNSTAGATMSEVESVEALRTDFDSVYRQFKQRLARGQPLPDIPLLDFECRHPSVQEGEK